MSAIDTAKEIVRIGSAAGLSKDVIDLMEKKLVLLTDELTNLNRRIVQLEVENGQLRAQLHHSQKVGFQEFGGILWKRTAEGFEPNPYCKECTHHPVMCGEPPDFEPPLLWQCPHGHSAPFAGRP